jgi:hypothetical protein
MKIPPALAVGMVGFSSRALNRDSQRAASVIQEVWRARHAGTMIWAWLLTVRNLRRSRLSIARRQS